MSDKVGMAFCSIALVAGLTVACSKKSDDTINSSQDLNAAAPDPAQGLVISQIYGGGGTSTGLWNRGYVELFNRTKAPISLSGLTIHYAGPISDFGVAATLPDAMVPAGGYYLVGFLAGQSGFDVRVDTNGLPVGILPVNGKLALVRAAKDDSGDAMAQKMGCGGADAGTCVGNARALDIVGYGVTTDHEGAETAGPPSMTTALFRKDGGCVDTGDNKLDFDIAKPAPRSSATAPHVCEGN